MSAGTFDSRGALEAVDRILNRGGEPDQVLRDVLEALATRGVAFARIRLAAAGGPDDAFVFGSQAPAHEAPITFGGVRVGTLEVSTSNRAFVERLATVVSAVSAESAKHFRRP